MIVAFIKDVIAEAKAGTFAAIWFCVCMVMSAMIVIGLGIYYIIHHFN